MNELIEQLKSRVNLNDDQARSAAETVINYLKQRLPAPVANQLDSVIAGQGGAEGIAGKVGDFLGKKSA